MVGCCFSPDYITLSGSVQGLLRRLLRRAQEFGRISGCCPGVLRPLPLLVILFVIIIL